MNTSWMYYQGSHEEGGWELVTGKIQESKATKFGCNINTNGENYIRSTIVYLVRIGILTGITPDNTSE